MASEFCKDYCTSARVCTVAAPMIRNQESVVTVKTSQLVETLAELGHGEIFLTQTSLAIEDPDTAHQSMLAEAKILVDTIYPRDEGNEVRSRMTEIYERLQYIEFAKRATEQASEDISFGMATCNGPILNRAGKAKEQFIHAKYMLARIGRLVTHAGEDSSAYNDYQAALDKNWEKNQICGSPKARHAAKEVIEFFGINTR